MIRNKNFRNLSLLAVVALAVLAVQSCKEEISMEDRYTLKEYTITTYLEAHKADYSEYVELLRNVTISYRSQSSVYQLLSARGKYTVFAPTNEAIQNYLDTLYSRGIIQSASWEGFPNEMVLDSIRKVIVFNSILDGTKDDVEPVQTSSFPDDTKEFTMANLYDRKLTIYHGGINGNAPDSLYVNGARDKNTGAITKGSLIDLSNRDIYTINGYIHQVHEVIAPSNETLSDLLRSYIEDNMGDYIVAAKMMFATGMIDTLSKVKDETYEKMKQAGDPRVDDLEPLGSENNGIISGHLPEHRYYGYTLFAETDDFWRTTLGKEPSEITAADIQAWIVSQGFYPEAKDNTDYASEDNALNMFFTYHLLPMRLPVDKLVIHYNERGYNYTNTSMSYRTPTYELYTTMGKRRLMKLYQAGPSYSLDGKSNIYINRFPELDNGRHGTYKEISVNDNAKGILIDTSDPINLVNAYIYPISEPLVYSQTTREYLAKQRLRFDVASMFPELMNNDFRANRNSEQKPGFPIDKNYRYLDDAYIEDGTRFYYLSGLGRNWQNWQGDEMNISGQYEFTLRLPPVPLSGTYELRYAIQSNSRQRSMCQIYFGTDKDNLPAMGIPLDLRQAGTFRALSSGNVASTLVGWELDTPDDDYNAEVDKKMRNNGFMKGAYNYTFTPGGNDCARDAQTTLRRIIVRTYMKPDEVYYIKFKNVLDDKDKQHYMDYLELCAKEVYDNPMTPEDIW